MGNRVRWHWEAVTPETQKVLKVLASHRTIRRQFYLAGGTALALRHGHRISRDLDLFSRSNTLDVGERGRVLTELSRLCPVSSQEEKEGTLHVILFKTHLSFFHYPHPLVGSGNRWKGVLVAGNEDIGLMKIAAIIGRGLARDFVDLYFICQEIPLDTLLGLASRKYPKAKDFYLEALKALVYFQDAEEETMGPTLLPVDWPVVRSFFEKRVRQLATAQFRR